MHTKQVFVSTMSSRLSMSKADHERVRVEREQRRIQLETKDVRSHPADLRKKKLDSDEDYDAEAVYDEMIDQVMDQVFGSISSTKQARDIYRALDSDNTGQLDMHELSRAVNQLNSANGFTLSKRKLAMVMKHLDKDGDGNLSFEEWNRNIFEGRLVQVRSKFKSNAYFAGDGRDFAKLFDFYDRENTGEIAFDAFRRAVRRDAKMTPTLLPDDDLHQLFEHLDEDHGGSISVDEFEKFLNEGEGAKKRSVVDDTFDAMYLYFEESGNNPRSLFTQYDDDGSGDLDLHEFIQAVGRTGLKIAKSKLALAFDSLDITGDETIGADEFYQRMRKTKRTLRQGGGTSPRSKAGHFSRTHISAGKSARRGGATTAAPTTSRGRTSSPARPASLEAREDQESSREVASPTVVAAVEPDEPSVASIPAEVTSTEPTTAEQLVLAVFDAVNLSGTGYLLAAEGKQYLSSSGCDPDRLEYFWLDFVAAADLDRDGRVSRKEYLQYMTNDEEIDEDGNFEDEEVNNLLRAQLKTLRRTSLVAASPSAHMASQPERSSSAETATKAVGDQGAPQDASTRDLEAQIAVMQARHAEEMARQKELLEVEKARVTHFQLINTTLVRNVETVCKERDELRVQLAQAQNDAWDKLNELQSQVVSLTSVA